MNHIKHLLSKINVETIKIELMNTAYGERSTLMAKLDPRVAIIWYLMFAILPWFFWNNTILIGMLLYMIILTAVSRISPLILFLLCFGIVTEAGYIIFVSIFFGGDLTAALALMTFTMKLTIISLASIVIFTNMDPERFSDALLRFKVPETFCFGISYGYRMLPILIDEYQSIFQSFRLRGKYPESKGVLGWRYIYHICVTTVKAFYPMILNTAKRTRTTVEALEVKGFTYGMHNPKAKELKLSYLKTTKKDALFLSITGVVLFLIIYTGNTYPIERTVHQL
ncbi:energy-coupling factor transporter transmembrane protein EcfT [Salibacterium salarium]|uniref:Energy-coupling factor transporter transmembrane protein EcfT n=1 Tax=Salibacterium salarium TaxID=284579 RepID=A0A3R9WP45_9BACI|nr:energy-coupling factor transporter transmembrane component T [Salibacterium salarium]RSL30489.1 energy-coupling factor transporter transmembrane protein EcfT [Salibacterium salarium]